MLPNCSCVESTSKCKMIIFFCKIHILVFQSVYFLLYVQNLFVCEIIEICLLGIYCLMSLLVFSIAPFCYDAYVSAK